MDNQYDSSYDEVQPETGLSQRQMDQDIEAALDWLDNIQEQQDLKQ